MKRIICVREVLAVLVVWVALSKLHSLHTCNEGVEWLEGGTTRGCLRSLKGKHLSFVFVGGPAIFSANR